MGAFVEALMVETHLNATAYMGLFGKKPNSHAKRQDVLAGHVMNFAFAQFLSRVTVEAYLADRGELKSSDDLLQWLSKRRISLTEKQEQAQLECPDLVTAR